MAINFPDNPSLNDTFVVNGVIYTWNGTSWVSSISSATVLNDLTDVDTTGAINGSVIKYDGANWIIGTDLDSVSYTDSDVDIHLNTGTATTGQILSWNGSDYDWVADQSGSSYDQSLNTTDDVTFNSVTTETLTVTGSGTTTFESGNNIVFDATNRVLVLDTPFRLAQLTTIERDAIAAPDNGDMIYNTNETRIEAYQNGSWGPVSAAGGISLTDLSVGPEGTPSGDGSLSYDNTTGVFTYTPANNFTEIQSWFESNINNISTITVTSPLAPATNTRFGNYIRIGENKIITSASNATIGGITSSGAAYIYDLDGTNQVTLLPSDPDAFDSFGFNSVAIGSSRAVVGVRSSDDVPNSSGSAYIFNLDGTNEIKITASDAAASDTFGTSVAVGDNKVVVGSPGNDDNAASSSGSIYIYDLDGTNEIKVNTSDPASSDFFGNYVTIGNSKIAASSIGDDPAGSVYIYDLDGTNEVKITPSDGVAGDNFGNGIKIISNKVYVLSSGGARGKIYSYNLDGTGEIIIEASALVGEFNQIGDWDVSESYVYMRYDNSLWRYDLDGTNETKLVINTGIYGEFSVGLGKIVINTAENGYINESFTIYDESVVNLQSDKSDIVSTRARSEISVENASGITPTSWGINSLINGGLSYNQDSGTIELTHLDIYYHSRHYSNDNELTTSPWSLYVRADYYWVDEVGGRTFDTGWVDIKRDFGVNPVVEGGIDAGLDYQEGFFIENIIGKTEYELDQTKWYRTIRPFTVRINTSGNGVLNPSEKDYFYWFVIEGTWFKFTSNPTDGTIYRFQPGRQKDDGFSLLYQYLDNYAPVNNNNFDGTVGYPLDTSDKTECAIKVMPGKSNRNDYTQEKFRESMLSWFAVETMVDSTSETKITSTGNLSGDAFGRSVAIGTTKMIIGAHFDDGRGSAFIYNLDGTGEIKLSPSDGISSDRYGERVAIDGNIVAVGAWGHDSPNGSSSGAVYIYDISSGDQTTIQATEIKVYASDGAAGDDYGLSVALHDNKLVVGARDNLTDGSIYVYDISSFVQGTILASEIKIRQSDAEGESSSNFGEALLVKDGKIVSSGAVTSTITGLPQVWTVYMYNMDGTGEQTFKPNPRDRLSSGNNSFDIYNGKLVVGVPYSYEYSSGASVSEIYIYDIATGNLEKDYTIESPYFEQYIGDTLRVYKDKIYASAYKYDIALGDEPYVQVIYVLDYFTGKVLQIIESSDNADGDRFGQLFDVGQDKLVVGADGDDPGGSIYIYDIITANEKSNSSDFNVTASQLKVNSSITETTHTLSGTSVALDPANGTIQTHNLSGPTTYTDSLSDGQSITLLIPPTANTITWPTIKWQDGTVVQPNASSDTLILIFKIGSTLYGSSGGIFS